LAGMKRWESRGIRQKRRRKNTLIKAVILLGIAFDAGMIAGLLIYMYQVLR